MLFDGPTRTEWAREFLSQPNHHLCVAYLDGQPAGFVSGIELSHPDKGREMFLYELGVADGFQRQGIGRQLVRALSDRARAVGCYGMWTLTDADNPAALATYRAAGSGAGSTHVMLDWDLAD